MKLGELKKSLTRFPSDMDDAEVLLTYGGEEEYDLLAFVSYADTNDYTAIVLGSYKVAQKK